MVEDGDVVEAEFKFTVPLDKAIAPVILTVGAPVPVTLFYVPPLTVKVPIVKVLAVDVVFKLNVPAVTFSVAAKLIVVAAELTCDFGVGTSTARSNLCDLRKFQ